MATLTRSDQKLAALVFVSGGFLSFNENPKLHVIEALERVLALAGWRPSMDGSRLSMLRGTLTEPRARNPGSTSISL